MTRKNKIHDGVAIGAGILLVINILRIDFGAFEWSPVLNSLAMLFVIISSLTSIKISGKE